MNTLRLVLPALAVCALALGGCEKKIDAPIEAGVCWQMIPLTGGKVKFNKVASNRTSLEACAASLEGVRERFMALGSSQEDMIGAYQGNYLFLGRNGVFTSTSLEGARWPALVRTSDGRLAPPSVVAQ